MELIKLIITIILVFPFLFGLILYYLFYNFSKRSKDIALVLSGIDAGVIAIITSKYILQNNLLFIFFLISFLISLLLFIFGFLYSIFWRIRNKDNFIFNLIRLVIFNGFISYTFIFAFGLLSYIYNFLF